MEKNYWLSWYCPNGLYGKFELHSPWWVSGQTMDEPSDFMICAAVKADSDEAARAIVINSHDEPYRDQAANVAWRFVEERPVDWSPFNDRFQRADWMSWPSLGQHACG